MRSGFDQRYAEHYDNWYRRPGGAQALNLERALIQGYLEPRVGERLLDIGCGTGVHLGWLRELGLQVTGLDASRDMLEQARRRVQGGADLHLGWAEHLPFEDNEFDLCTMINTLEFVEDSHKALAEAIRVTRRRLVLGVLNKYALMAMHRRLKGLLTKSIYRQARFFSVWELKEMVQKITGPTPIRWGTVLFFPLSFMGLTRPVEYHPLFQQNPWGAFIGMRVDISYRFIVCKDHLSSPVRPARGRVPQGTLRVWSLPAAWREKQPPEVIVRLQENCSETAQPALARFGSTCSIRRHT
ncbi:MAG: class I SAM-dependent methyltransferase, partial [Syntrophobacteria bacterium]